MKFALKVLIDFFIIKCWIRLEYVYLCLDFDNCITLRIFSSKRSCNSIFAHALLECFSYITSLRLVCHQLSPSCWISWWFPLIFKCFRSPNAYLRQGLRISRVIERSRKLIGQMHKAKGKSLDSEKTLLRRGVLIENVDMMQMMSQGVWVSENDCWSYDANLRKSVTISKWPLTARSKSKVTSLNNSSSKGKRWLLMNLEKRRWFLMIWKEYKGIEKWNWYQILWNWNLHTIIL